jgi:hypothetical protein
VDILYDLAFVLMDLWHRRLEPLANVLFNRYLEAIGDETGTGLLPFFMAVRAAVRAHVTAMDGGEPQAARLAGARAYLRLCRDLLQVRPPILVAVGGYSGSGAAAGVPAGRPHRRERPHPEKAVRCQRRDPAAGGCL